MMVSSQWLPIAGVLIGWFFNELSWHYRAGREERRALTKALSALLFVYFDRLRYRMILSVVNERMGDKLMTIHHKYGSSDQGAAEAVAALKRVESARRLMSYDPKVTTERTANSLRAALEDLAAADAILSLKARQILEDHEYYSEVNLEPLLADP